MSGCVVGNSDVNDFKDQQFGVNNELIDEQEEELQHLILKKEIHNFYQVISFS